MTPRLTILSRLYCALCRDLVNEEIYDARVAGLKCSIEHRAKFIIISIRGYNDKLPHLTMKIMKMMKGFKVDKERFAIVKEQVRVCRA